MENDTNNTGPHEPESRPNEQTNNTFVAQEHSEQNSITPPSKNQSTASPYATDYSVAANQPKVSRTKILMVALFAVAIAIAFGVQQYQINRLQTSLSNTKNTNKADTSTTTQTTDKKAYPYGSRGGVKLLRPVDEQSKAMLDLLAIYNSQNGSYPKSETAVMIQELQRYGYNAMSAGPNLRCPDDEGHFSYTGYINPSSNQVDSFGLYYCDGSTLVTKTQTDIAASKN